MIDSIQDTRYNPGQEYLPNVENKESSKLLKDEFLNIFKDNHSVYTSCNKLGISRTLVYNDWLIKDNDFKTKYEEIREGFIDGVEGNVIHRALTDDRALQAQVFVLSKLRREVWGDKNDINVNISVDHRLSENAGKILAGLNIADVTEVEMLPDANDAQCNMPAIEQGSRINDNQVQGDTRVGRGIDNQDKGNVERMDGK